MPMWLRLLVTLLIVAAIGTVVYLKFGDEVLDSVAAAAGIEEPEAPPSPVPATMPPTLRPTSRISWTARPWAPPPISPDKKPCAA